jgi:hypothetical protein
VVPLPQPLPLGLGVLDPLCVAEAEAQMVGLVLCVTLWLEERLPLKETLPVRVPLLQKLPLTVLVEDTDSEGVLVPLNEPLELRVGERDGDRLGEVEGERDAEAQVDGETEKEEEEDILGDCVLVRVEEGQKEEEWELLVLRDMDKEGLVEGVEEAHLEGDTELVMVPLPQLLPLGLSVDEALCVFVTVRQMVGLGLCETL